MIVLVLAVHLPGLLALQLLTGVAPLHALGEILPSGLLALAASFTPFGRRLRSVAAAVGLMAAAACSCTRPVG